LVLPPKLAPIHVAIVPIYKNDEEMARVMAVANRVAAELRDDGLSVKLDDRNELKPGAKYYEWERKGVPIRLEIGPRDVDQNVVMAKMRIAPTEANGKPQKLTLQLEGLSAQIGRLLDEFQKFLFQRALDLRTHNTVTIDNWSDFCGVFAGDNNSMFVWAHWDGTPETEQEIKAATKATIRCIPIEGEGPAVEAGVCVKSGRPSAQRVLFSKNY
jgi:prolyl-tRNA synthetase